MYGDFEYLNFIEEKTRYTCKEYPNGFPEDVLEEFSKRSKSIKIEKMKMS